MRALDLPHARSDTDSYVTVSVVVACMYPVFSNTNGVRGAHKVISLAETLNASLAQDLFEQADTALYLAKQRGRNCVMLQTSGHSAQTNLEMTHTALLELLQDNFQHRAKPQQLKVQSAAHRCVLVWCG